MMIRSEPTASRISAIGNGRPVKWTGMTARVASVSAADKVDADTFQVVASMSAKRGVAPTYAAQLALAAKVIALVSSSSPGPSPAAQAAACSAAVPEENETANGASTAAANSCSNAA